MDWNEVTALATVAATLITLGAFVATAIYVISAVRAFEKDQFVGASGELFSIFQSRDFMDDQLWIIHRLEAKTWPEFISAHRADAGEAAFHRVGAVYNRVGNLIRMRLIKPGDILPIIGPYAIAVWNKIEPLVYEARRVENSTLFIEFEKMLPDCYECYVPALGPGGEVIPFATTAPVVSSKESHPQTRDTMAAGGRPPVATIAAEQDQANRITLDEARKKLAKHNTQLLDVRKAKSFAEDPRLLPGAIRMEPGQIEQHYAELPRDREIIPYCS